MKLGICEYDCGRQWGLAKWAGLGAAVLAVGLPTAHGQDSNWTRKAISGPAAVESPAMAFDSARGVAVLFGGLAGAGPGYSGETWEWDGRSWSLRSVTGPSPRAYHAMAFDSARGVTVLFGGLANNTSDRETWEWDGTTWILRATDGPPAQHLAAMAYDSARAVTVLYSGSSDSGVLGGTWEWDGTGQGAWTRRATGGPGPGTPSPRWGHAMTYDPVHEVTLLFGGNSGGSELWEWDGSGAGSWTLRTPAGGLMPVSRYGHGMAFDFRTETVVIFGGTIGVRVTDETWRWDGASWTRAVGANPSARYYHAIAYDSARNAAIVFGGHVCPGRNSAETWELGQTGQWCPADTNADGFLDFFDYDAFVTAFELGDLSADFNRDCFLDFFDYDAFVEAFETGC
jgi:hypothetical protein